MHSMKDRPNAVILVFLSRGQSFVRPSEDVEKLKWPLRGKRFPTPALNQSDCSDLAKRYTQIAYEGKGNVKWFDFLLIKILYQ